MSSNLFNSVKGVKHKRNAFSSFSYRNDGTCNIGQLVPIYIEHYLPNTYASLSAAALLRFQALIAPIMDNVYYYVHFWKVPWRLVDPNFPKFVGGEIDEEEYNPPYITGKSVNDYIALLSGESLDTLCGNGSLMDYLGWDYAYFTKKNTIKSNIRELQIYAFVLQHWYINEHVLPWDDFEDDVADLLAAEGDATTEVCTFLVHLNTAMGRFFNHGWPKDYFTSALPNVQDGDAVTLGIAGTAPVSIASTNQSLGIRQIANNVHFAGELEENYHATLEANMASNLGAGTLSTSYDDDNIPVTSIDTVFPDQTGVADLSEATAITINELRVANALQVFKERIMRGGHRVNEYYKMFFGVCPKDLRLQLPQYLGGGKIPVNVAAVEQTSSTDSVSAKGSLAGKATSLAGGFAGFKTFCDEETCIMGFAWIMPKPSYVNAMRRFKLKLNDRFDYFNPSFEHLGEQAIQNIEVYAGGNGSEFGYTPRFAEYRFHNNEQHGQFKDTLAFWTLGRIFTSQPSLNADFVYMQPSAMQRIFAVTEDSQHNPVPNCNFSVLFNVQVLQPVSKYGTPMLLA